MSTILRCDVCGYIFSTKSNLIRHKNTVIACIDKASNICSCGYESNNQYNYKRHIVNCVIHDYEQQISSLKEKIALLNEEMDQQSIEIHELKKENIELKIFSADKGGQIKVYETHPGKTTVIGTANYINPKLLNVKCDTIRPFTIDTVKEDVANGVFTYEHFIKGAKGIADFVSTMTTQDDQRSYVCTDVARSKFHRLLESRKWTDDNGATFLNNVFDELEPLAREYYTRIVKMVGDIPENGQSDDRDFNDILLQRVKPIYFSIKDKKSASRTDMLNKVRVEVKKLAAV